LAESKAPTYRTVVGWNHKKTRSEPGDIVPRSTPEKVVASLLKAGAIEKDGEK
jgi:hypothetical protein